MTVLSKVDDNSSEYGTYVTFVATQKYGPRTPVRRSRRHYNGTSHPMKQKEVSKDIGDFSDGEVKEKNCVFVQSDIDDLCSIFQTTLVVDNDLLVVADSKTQILSPEPKYDHCVEVIDDAATTITPVDRSDRNVKGR